MTTQRCRMLQEQRMGKYQKGDHVKFEVNDEGSRESEWMWLLVEESDDEQEIVFGRLDSQPVVVADMKVGQELAVSYDKVRDHRRFAD
jgi:uncharacterized protein YegJ (DUF2314 family)